MKGSEKSSTGLTTNDGATLCYVVGWISGLVFLIIETKDRVVRFHAMQAIVVFGGLHIAMLVLGSLRSLFGWTAWNGSLLPLEVTFTVLQSLLIAFSVVLWIVLMIWSHQGRTLVLPLAGGLSLRLLSRLDGSAPDLESGHGATAAAAGGEEPHAAALRSPRERHFRREEIGIGRTAGSVAAIVWSIVLFILFNFYAGYLAFYQGVPSDGATQLLRYPVLTAELARVLPILNAALGVTVIGHVVALSVDRSVVHQVVQIVAHVMGIVTVVVFLKVFPFDFGDLPFGDAVEVFPSITIGVLAVIAVLMGIETIMRLVRLVTHMASED